MDQAKRLRRRIRGSSALDIGDPDPDREQRWSHGRLLPVPVVLRAFAAWLRNGAGTLRDFIETKLLEGEFAACRDAIAAALDSGTALVLLDGLDEVPDAEGLREQVVSKVQEFADGAGQSGCRTVATAVAFFPRRTGTRYFVFP